jgi:hypothetical protein
MPLLEIGDVESVTQGGRGVKDCVDMAFLVARQTRRFVVLVKPCRCFIMTFLCWQTWKESHLSSMCIHILICFKE